MTRPLAFVSYARSDIELARPLAAYLRSRGYESWIDVEDLAAGEDWESSVRDAISRSDHYVACVSHRSAQSRWTSFELECALASKAVVWPVLYGEEARAALPAVLHDVEPVDVTTLSAERAAFEAARHFAMVGVATVEMAEPLWIARAIHERWRSALRAAGVNARWKATEPVDLSWLVENGERLDRALRASGSEANILALRFDDLPPSVAEDVMLAVDDAVSVIRVEQGGALEELAQRVHESWVSRNRKAAPDALLAPYRDLPEGEKEKDRIVVRTTAMALGLPIEG
jgi:hypothetical protein